VSTKYKQLQNIVVLKYVKTSILIFLYLHHIYFKNLKNNAVVFLITKYTNLNNNINFIRVRIVGYGEKWCKYDYYLHTKFKFYFHTI